MGKIVSPIPVSAFELIRDRIADILIDEIEQQAILTYEPLFDKAEVVVEDINPEDKADLPSVNVTWASATYDSKDYSGAVRANPYVFHVDVYTNAKSTKTIDGSYSSAKKMQMMLRVIRGILENPIYKTLGYKPPYIQRVFISNISLSNAGKNDAMNTMMGRIVFNVVVAENVDLIVPQLIQGYDTTIRIGESNSGYHYNS